MINVLDVLERVKDRAKNDDDFRKALIYSYDNDGTITGFCRFLNDNGFEINAMDIVNAGEESYAAMRRSTNGGGENSPLLKGEDDLFEMFMIDIKG